MARAKGQSESGSPTKTGNYEKGVKKPKRFLESNDMLMLATSIASEQEQKSQKRVEKYHHHNSQNADQRPRVSASKIKLKETKAMLAARDKVKRRKRQFGSEERGGAPAPKSKEKTRKSVTFA